MTFINIESLKKLTDVIKPIHDLELSIGFCIGLNIIKYIDMENIENPFGDININISNEYINIRTNMDDNWLGIFSEICRDCYITKHLTFKKKIINGGKVIEI